MPKAIYTKEELRLKKNVQSRKKYAENEEHRKSLAKYHADLYLKKKENPDFLKNAAEKQSIWRKSNPDKVKEASARSRAKNSDEINRRTREWFKKNPDKRVAYQQNRYAKIKSAKGNISLDIRIKLMALQKGLCICCRGKLKEKEIHLDHIQPLSKGGKHEDNNLQLLCNICNNQKYNKDPIDFMQSKGYLL